MKIEIKFSIHLGLKLRRSKYRVTKVCSRKENVFNKAVPRFQTMTRVIDLTIKHIRSSNPLHQPNQRAI